MTLIDKDALTPDMGFGRRDMYSQKAIDNAPLIDAVEVVHAYWIDTGEYVTTAYGHLDIYKCSKCNAEITIDGCDGFCPNCGAKMDGHKKEGL